MNKRNYKTKAPTVFIFAGSLDECLEMMTFYVNRDLENLLKKAEGI